MTFSLPHLGHLIFALARSVMVSVASNSFSQLSHRNSYRGINSSSQLASARRVYLCLRLLQPKPHIHLAVQRRRGGEMLLGLLRLTHSPIEPADTEVTAGEERAQPQLLGQRFGVLARPGSGLEIRGVLGGRDLPENLERPGLIGPLTKRRSQLEPSVSRSLGLLGLPVEQESFRPREVEVRRE